MTADERQQMAAALEGADPRWKEELERATRPRKFVNGADPYRPDAVGYVVELNVPVLKDGKLLLLGLVKAAYLDGSDGHWRYGLFAQEQYRDFNLGPRGEPFLKSSRSWDGARDPELDSKRS